MTNSCQITASLRLRYRFRQPNGKKGGMLNINKSSFEISYYSKDQPCGRNVYKIKVGDHGWYKSLIMANSLVFMINREIEFNGEISDSQVDKWFNYLNLVQLKDICDLLSFPSLSYNDQIKVIEKYSSKNKSKGK
jgi:hypothetical protein